MICAAAEKSEEKGGGIIVFMGLTDDNIDALKRDLPITIKLSEKTQGKLDSELFILYGKDDEALKRKLLGDGEVEVGEEKHDAPKSLRQEFMENVEKLLGMVGGLPDSGVSGEGWQSDELEHTLNETQKLLDKMKGF